MNRVAFFDPDGSAMDGVDIDAMQISLATAPYEKGQTSIETEHGWFDILSAKRVGADWRLLGIFTAKVPV